MNDQLLNWLPAKTAPRDGSQILVKLLPQHLKTYDVVYWSDLHRSFQMTDWGSYAEDADASDFSEWAALPVLNPPKPDKGDAPSTEEKTDE